jgi:putative redox protein
MTVRMYANLKGWPLEAMTVRLRHARMHAKDCEDCETKEGMIDRIEREVQLGGPLSEAQLTRLMEIVNKCPIHRTLTSEIRIPTKRVP